MTIVGLPHWQPLHGTDQLWMAALCCTAALGHWLLIRAFEAAEASAIQPFAYLQLVFIAAIGLTVFGEVLRLNVVIGAIVVGLVDTLGRFLLPKLFALAMGPAAGATVGAALASMLIYIVMAAVLAVRPKGLFPAAKG